jgi:hypothetical protein
VPHEAFMFFFRKRPPSEIARRAAFHYAEDVMAVHHADTRSRTKPMLKSDETILSAFKENLAL